MAAINRFAPPGDRIDIGGGRRLHLLRRGKGYPTVVFDAGLGDSGLIWSTILDRLAGTTRVCAYDRAGLGWSDPAMGPRTGNIMAADLERLLYAAGELGPFVLVGHSSGCHLMRLFAHAFPAKVAGLVLIDPPVFTKFGPSLMVAVSAARRTMAVIARLGIIRRLAKSGRIHLLYGGQSPPAEVTQAAAFLYRPEAIDTSFAEVRGLPETIRQVNTATFPGAWRDWPMLVISAHKGERRFLPVQRLQAELAELSSRGRHLLVAGSHFIPFQHPDVVVEAIQQILDEIKS